MRASKHRRGFTIRVAAPLPCGTSFAQTATTETMQSPSREKFPSESDCSLADLTEDEELTSQVLPGFRCDLREVFASPVKP